MAFLAVTPPSHHRPHRHEGTPPPSLLSHILSVLNYVLFVLYYYSTCITCIRSHVHTHKYTFIKAMLICPPLSAHHSSLPSHQINTHTLPPPPPLFHCPNTHTQIHIHNLSHTNTHTYTRTQYADYAVRLQQEIHDAGYHADVDESARTLNKKVRAHCTIKS